MHRSHHPFPAAAGIALVALKGSLVLRETTTEDHRNHSTNDRSEMGTGDLQAQANEVRGQAKMTVNRPVPPMKRNRVSRTKGFGHMGTALAFSRKGADRSDPETDLQEAPATGVQGLQETRWALSIVAHDRHVAETGIRPPPLIGPPALHAMGTGAPAAHSTAVLVLHVTEIGAPPSLSTRAHDLHVMETGVPAALSIEVLDLHATKIDVQLALLTGVLDLHVTETGTFLTTAPIDLLRATAFSTMMCQ